MRIDVDLTRCEGHGLCAERAPAIFHLDDDGELHNELEGLDVPPELRDAARAAAEVCPVAALRLLDG